VSYDLKISPRAAQVIWGALLELPGKVAFDTMLEIKPQLEAQESPLPTLQPEKPEGASNG